MTFVGWFIVGIGFCLSAFSIGYAGLYLRAQYLRARQRRLHRNQIRPMR